MIAKYAGQCLLCGETIPKGADCDYDPFAKKIKHRKCPDIGAPGGYGSDSDAGESAIELAGRLGYTKV